MPWGKIDDNLHHHPKVLAAGNAAVGALMRSISWSNAHGTDGFIPSAVAATMANAAEVEALTAPWLPGRHALWEAVDGGYLIHDFFEADRNLPASWWADHSEGISAQRRLAGKASAEARRLKFGTAIPNGARNGPPNGRPNGPHRVPNELPNGVPNEPSNELPNPVPGPGIAPPVAKATSPSPGEPMRADVMEVCTLLTMRMVENGAKVPTAMRTWHKDARLLLDRDERPLDEVLAVIDWAQADPFWRSNVLSVHKLRKNYDQLRLSMQRPRSGQPVSRARKLADEARALQEQGR